jgi:squalene-hopene/tetraprenyl-beta-curcumene cyclase
MRRAVEWVLDRQILVHGDWSVRAKKLSPGGWAFQRANVLYPDVDDTAIALLMLSQLKAHCDEALRARIEQAIERAVSWTLGMQCSNGGWAAFDRDNTKSIISAIPFCNFGEALDPPSVDVTAHVLEEGVFGSFVPSRKKTVAGLGAGASTTSTVSVPYCRRSRR